MDIILKKQLQLREGKNKGFTLVEVIVVLVILAILMAIAIPALTGYIEKASQRAAIADARNFLTGLQSVASEAYATTNGDPVYGTISTKSKVRIGPWMGNESASKTRDETYLEAVSALTKQEFKPSQFYDTPKSKQITFSGKGESATVVSFYYHPEGASYDVKYTNDLQGNTSFTIVDLK